MSAAIIPPHLMPGALTDADWAQDFVFTNAGQPADFSGSTFTADATPTATRRADRAFNLSSAAGSLVLADNRIGIRVPAASMQDVAALTYRLELREHRADGGISALVLTEVVIGQGLSNSAPGVALGGSPFVNSGGTITIDRTPQGILIDTGVGGPAGRPGVSAALFEHVQSSPLAEWTVNHNLGHRPSVTVFSPGGVEVCAAVVHQSVNQLRIYFSAPQTGSVHCV